MSQNITESIKQILAISKNSPSSHNTQPWFVSLNNDILTVGYRPERQLRVGDPDKRELFMSLGCFIETICLAAESLGYSASVKYLGTSPEAVASVHISSSTSIGQDWAEVIKNRRSDRRLYEAQLVPNGISNELHDLKRGGASVVMFSRDNDKGFLAQVTYDATLKAMSNDKFREELSLWVRHNWTKEPDGMPAYTQGIPGPVSLFARFIIKKNKKVAKDQAKKDSKRVTNSSLIGLICIGKENAEEWINAGRLYQALCITAAKYGIKTSGISAAVIDPGTTTQIATSLKLKDKPVGLLRFGYKKGLAKASPRLKVAQFLSN